MAIENSPTFDRRNQPRPSFVPDVIETRSQNRLKGALFIAKVVALSCLLGVTVNLVTANVAVEYFTIHHPHVVDSDSPWVMALIWGIGASWWCGLILAPLLWWANVRRRAPLSVRKLLIMVAKAMGLIWLIMMIVLLGVYLVGGMVPLEQRRASFESDRRLMAVAIAHMIEYALAVVMTIVLCVRISRATE